MTADGRVPAIGAQVGQVTAHAFGTRQDDQVRRRYRLPRPHKLQVHLRVQAQRVKVGVIADARQHGHHHLEHVRVFLDLTLINAVFGFKVQVHHVWQHADHRFAGALLQPVQTRLQQRDITAKTVDDETFDPRLLALGQQLKGADQMREDPAAIDVGNQDHRAIYSLGKPHVGNVTGAQIDLGGRAGTFDHDHRVGRAQALMRGQHRLHRDGFVIVVSHRVHAGHGAAVNNHLRTGVAVRFEQHRVHVGVWRQPRGLRLNRLCASDLAPLGGHGTVERHVLRLERHHADALAGHPATQRRHQRTFTGVRRRALHHQCAHGVSWA